MAIRRIPTLWTDLSHRPRGRETVLPIETVRIVATLLLVGYHVVGSAPSAGLAIDYPHPVRILADLLRDVRMPLFAFIAGLVFALRPLRAGDVPRFLRGKLRRLVLPGAVAIALTALASGIMGGQGVLTGPAWHLLVFPYLHFWFLMSILLIFAVYAPIDAATTGAALVPALGIAIALSLSPWQPSRDVLSVAGAIYLLPYFLLGVLFHRRRQGVDAGFALLVPAAALAVAVATAVQLDTLVEIGAVPDDRRDVQSLVMRGGICLLAMLLLPRSQALDRFGPYAFTIYLYHIFGTASARLLLDALGIGHLGVHIVVGLACGFGLPILLHMAAARFAVTRLMMLGIRPMRAFGRVLPGGEREAARG